MNINLKVKFSTKDHSWLCFKHAVQEAMKGIDVDHEVDDYSSEYYMGSTYCNLCHPEPEVEEEYTPPKRNESLCKSCIHKDGCMSINPVVIIGCESYKKETVHYRLNLERHPRTKD